MDFKGGDEYDALQGSVFVSVLNDWVQGIHFHLFAVNSTRVSVRYVGGSSGLLGKLFLAHLSVCSTNKPDLEICVRIKQGINKRVVQFCMEK